MAKVIITIWDTEEGNAASTLDFEPAIDTTKPENLTQAQQLAAIMVTAVDEYLKK